MRGFQLLQGEALPVCIIAADASVHPIIQLCGHPGIILLCTAWIECSASRRDSQPPENASSFALNAAIESSSTGFPPVLPGDPKPLNFLRGLRRRHSQVCELTEQVGCMRITNWIHLCGEDATFLQ